MLADVPRVLEQAERAALSFADASRTGFRLDDETVKRIAAEGARGAWGQTVALWLAAVALLAIAGALWINVGA